MFNGPGFYDALKRFITEYVGVCESLVPAFSLEETCAAKNE